METANQKQFELLTTWDAIDEVIIHAHRALLKEVCDRMKNPLYRRSGKDGVLCTLHYLFEVIRVGVFVCVRDNVISAFIPFANAGYRNNWSEILRFEKSFRNKRGKIVRTTTDRVQEYLREKKKHLFSVRPMELDTTKWSANAYFVNSNKRDDVWGTHSLREFYDLINAALAAHPVKDCIFFLNKRDFPLLRKDLCEPYSFLWGTRPSPKVDPERVHFKGSFAPIVSPYTNGDYMDLPFPIAQDWLLASEPENYFNADNLHSDWEGKLPTAFFRGSLTGRVDPLLNPRAILATLNAKWNNTKFSVAKDGKKVPLLDAGVTSWNLSDKVDRNGIVRFTHPKEMPFALANRVPMNESVRKYKYILNVDGHARPNRTGFLLACGSLMLLVEPKFVVGSVTWIDNVLKPWTHYVPVSGDLSDLEERIRWCINHDAECREIVAQAEAFAKKYFTRKVVTEYMAYTLNAIATRSCN